MNTITIKTLGRATRPARRRRQVVILRSLDLTHRYSPFAQRRRPDVRRLTASVLRRTLRAAFSDVATLVVTIAVLTIAAYHSIVITDTVGSLTAADVSNAIGANRAVNAKGNITSTSTSATINDSAAIIADISARTSKALDRLSDNIEQGILAEVVMDGERGLARKLNHYKKLNQNVLR